MSVAEVIGPEAGDQSASPDEDLTPSRARDELATIRDQLRETVPELGPAMVDAFRKSMEASKRLRIHEPCAKCGCQHVRYVEAPDFMERARAIDLLATNAEGRAAVASDVSQSRELIRRVGKDRS